MTAMSHTITSTAALVPTGIDALDVALGGGITDRATLMYGEWAQDLAHAVFTHSDHDINVVEIDSAADIADAVDLHWRADGPVLPNLVIVLREVDGLSGLLGASRCDTVLRVTDDDGASATVHKTLCGTVGTAAVVEDCLVQ